MELNLGFLPRKEEFKTDLTQGGSEAGTAALPMLDLQSFFLHSVSSKASPSPREKGSCSLLLIFIF